MAYQGRFKPKNLKKYKGDSTNITYRSRWELRFMTYCDKHPEIISWSSEEVVIPYKSPIDGRWHRYYPDFLITYINKHRSKETVLIEIKPDYQTRPPEKQKRITKKYLNEVKTWGINEAKWKAAEEFCKDRNWQFKIMTEKDLNL